MMAIAYGGQYASTRVLQLARRGRVLQQAFGVLVIATAIAMFFNYDTVIAVSISNLSL